MGITKNKQSLENISESVRTHRTNKGWSQLELANRAGLDRKTVNRVENGRFAPSVETLLLVGDALGVSMNNLLGNK
jgi:transcriptional regulator with XRE-family HTH domain